MTKKTDPDSKSNLSTDSSSGKSVGRMRANLGAPPHYNSAVVSACFSSKVLGEVPITDMFDVILEKINFKSENLEEAEAILMGQAVALNSMFSALAKRACNNMDGYVDSAEKYMRLAFKAQAQSARTLEILTAMKNPPVVFAKQANIAQGPQQVNNGVPAAIDTDPKSRAEKSEYAQNKLLEVNHGERLDTRATSVAGGTDQTMGALEEVFRSEN